MQVKPGYKQTEAGVIPDDWLHLSLGRVSKLQRGFDLPHRSRKKGEIPIITSSGFGEYHSESRVQGPGVVTGRYGTIGEVFYIRENFWPLNTTLYVKDFYENDPLYISYLLRRIDFHKHSGKSGVPGINRNDLHEIVVALPPSKAEQQAIAEALSDADALIESLDELIAKKRQIKQGAMQELLTGKRRLAGFSGEWVFRSLGEICSMKSGFSITGEAIDEHSPFPCYGGNGLRGFTATYTHDGRYGLIGRQGALCGNVVCVKGQFFASEHAIVVTPKSTTDIDWLTFVLRRMNLNQYSESSAQPGLSVSKLKVLECDVPPYEEQTAIAIILSDMDTELTALESRLAKARQIKQGMMQELLTGRIRLLSKQ